MVELRLMRENHIIFSQPIVTMDIENLCSPAILYVGFSLTHIIIDMGREQYPSAIVKFFIMMVFTLILDMLCKRGLGTVSWLLVLIPFVSMTLITSILLSMFGVNTYSSTVRINSPTKESVQASAQAAKNALNSKVESEMSYNDVPYDPDDFSSGTPEEVNHYNNPGDESVDKAD